MGQQLCNQALINPQTPHLPKAVVRKCCEKGIIENCAKFTGKHLYWNLFLNMVAG